MTARVFFLSFIFLKQFYIFPSGKFGIGDACLAAACFFLVLNKIKRKEKLLYEYQDRWGLGFVLGIIIVNFVYFFIYRKIAFIQYTLFWIYNTCAIICFREIINKGFLRKISIILKISILLQFLSYLTGVGRWFQEYWGGMRYMGTFNVPNQFAFYVFAAMLLLYIYACQYNDRTFPVFYLLSVLLIAVSKSTGIFVGIFLFTFGISMIQLKKYYQSGRLPKKYWWIIGGGLTAIFITGIYIIWPSEEFMIQYSDFSILSRIQEKILKLSEGGLVGFFYDRGAEKLIFYPQYMLWGAGEGYYERFTLSTYVNEIHSSLLSILFCYGIVPTLCLIKWIWEYLKKGSKKEKVALFALLGESFFLVNYRQPFFWMIIVMLGNPRKDRLEIEAINKQEIL